MAQLAALCLAGDFVRARDLHRRYLPLMEINFVESNPGPVKAALAMMGLIELEYRLPMVTPQPPNLDKIEKVLESLGLLAARAVQCS